MHAMALIAFGLAFFIFAVSPGSDNMTILARTIHHGPASGLAYGLGTVTGILVFLSLAAVGLSAFAAEMGWVMVVFALWRRSLPHLDGFPFMDCPCKCASTKRLAGKRRASAWLSCGSGA